MSEQGPSRGTFSTHGIGTFAALGEFDPALDSVDALGIDSGATLVKLCARKGDALHFATWLSPSHERLAELVERVSPRRLGVTGCGSAALVKQLEAITSAEAPSTIVNPIEFEAWARGANEMLARSGQGADAPYLLISVGTGTSALHIDGDRVERIGGTALGGGAALGLGYALLGVRTPEALNALALRGARQNVDLMVSDLFEDVAAVGAIIASAFGKLARHASSDGAVERPSDEDLAAATLGIVADNIGLLVAAHANAVGVDRVVYGGSTLYAHPQMADTFRAFGIFTERETIVLEHGGHAGALGAMLLGDA